MWFSKIEKTYLQQLLILSSNLLGLRKNHVDAHKDMRDHNHDARILSFTAVTPCSFAPSRPSERMVATRS